MKIMEEPVSKWVVYSTILIFILMGLSALFFSVSSFINLLSDMYNNLENISLHKGLFYAFGAGLGCLILVVDGVCTHFLDGGLSPYMHQLLTRLALASLVILFILPHIIHYTADNYLEKNNYQVCESKSSQWLFVSKIVYTKPGQCVGD